MPPLGSFSYSRQSRPVSSSSDIKSCETTPFGSSRPCCSTGLRRTFPSGEDGNAIKTSPKKGHQAGNHVPTLVADGNRIAGRNRLPGGRQRYGLTQRDYVSPWASQQQEAPVLLCPFPRADFFCKNAGGRPPPIFPIKKGTAQPPPECSSRPKKSFKKSEIMVLALQGDAHYTDAT